MGLALGELSEPQRSEVRAHAMECDECRTELRRLERLLDDFRFTSARKWLGLEPPA